MNLLYPKSKFKCKWSKYINNLFESKNVFKETQTEKVLKRFLHKKNKGNKNCITKSSSQNQLRKK